MIILNVFSLQNLKSGTGGGGGGFSDLIFLIAGFTRDMESRAIGQKMIETGVRITRRWTDEKYYKDKPLQNYYNHWQTSFLTEDPRVAEKKAREQWVYVVTPPPPHTHTHTHFPNFCFHTVKTQLVYKAIKLPTSAQ